jgi:Uma2 family endonuclease
MAAMRAVNPRVSFAELQQWPEDGRRYELYDGEVIVSPSPFPRHQRVAWNVGDVIKAYERVAGGLVFAVPIDIVFSEYDVLQPDVVYFREARRHVVKMMEATRAAPDLAVEILSRSTETRDRGRKLQMLARYGVPEYWIVDPVGNTIEIYTNRGGSLELSAMFGERDEVESPTLPDLRFHASRIFEE